MKLLLKSFSIIFLTLVLVAGCSSRRLEYQQMQNDTSLSSISKGLTNKHNFSEKFKVTKVSKSNHSYAPDDVDLLVPRPNASIIKKKSAYSGGSIKLKDYAIEIDDITRVDTDSRFRPSLISELPLPFLNKKLVSFLSSKSIDYKKITPNNEIQEECLFLYKLKSEPISLCLTKTISKSYVTSLAEDTDNDELKEKGLAILKDLSSKIN